MCELEVDKGAEARWELASSSPSSCRLNFLKLPKGLTVGPAASKLTFSVPRKVFSASHWVHNGLVLQASHPFLLCFWPWGNRSCVPILYMRWQIHPESTSQLGWHVAWVTSLVDVAKYSSKGQLKGARETWAKAFSWYREMQSMVEEVAVATSGTVRSVDLKSRKENGCSSSLPPFNSVHLYNSENNVTQVRDMSFYFSNLLWTHSHKYAHKCISWVISNLVKLPMKTHHHRNLQDSSWVGKNCHRFYSCKILCGKESLRGFMTGLEALPIQYLLCISSWILSH